ncbi:DUF2637 domain-containing protein [Actinomadura harenae]|uniref:DUF2637 domain-containing protein n=1 Tax=Actinomadura harenae TaxID=2483351 RepID=A0A3M2MDM1_9ACTN|nr:DUF2637 domain-containing protein [Actinomadura harenae]RMI45308.1 DUF2637 domain-containing protein [Actinomadura harenae]
MSWDARSERITAKAVADKAAAEAEALRSRTAMEREAARAELDDRRSAGRRTRRAESRAAFAGAIRRRASLALPVVAVGSPAVLAWRGQGQFADTQMGLGLLSPLLPIAIEGSVLYCAYLAHQAVAARLPAARFRVLSWLLAFVAAGMNFWHGSTASGMQVGAALAVTSLLSIVLLELTIVLRKSLQEQEVSGRSATEIRRRLIRRLRYPRLSLSADALAAARGLDAETAWRAAWVERYGLGPEATRWDRRIARRILRYDHRAAKQLARDTELTIVDGQLVPAIWFNDNDGTTPMARGDEQPLVDSSAWDDIISLNVRERAPGMIDDIERYLTEQADRPGGPLMELPPAADERTTDQRERHAEQRSDERGEERTGRRRAKREERRSSHRKSGRGSARRAPQGAFEERLSETRRLMDEADNRLSTAELAERLNIGRSTARNLLRKVRIERGLITPIRREDGEAS